MIYFKIFINFFRAEYIYNLRAVEKVVPNIEIEEIFPINKPNDKINEPIDKLDHKNDKIIEPNAPHDISIDENDGSVKRFNLYKMLVLKSFY